MPNFPGPLNGLVPVQSNASPIALARPGDSCYLFGVLASTATQLPVNDSNIAFEAAPAGAGAQGSIAVLLAAAEDAPAPAVAIEIVFPSAPGAGESIAIQEADTHGDGFFITPSNPAYTVTSFNANGVARVDLSPTGGKFMRVARTKGANAVGCTVKITRLA